MPAAWDMLAPLLRQPAWGSAGQGRQPPAAQAPGVANGCPERGQPTGRFCVGQRQRWPPRVVSQGAVQAVSCGSPWLSPPL